MKGVSHYFANVPPTGRPSCGTVKWRHTLTMSTALYIIAALALLNAGRLILARMNDAKTGNGPGISTRVGQIVQTRRAKPVLQFV